MRSLLLLVVTSGCFVQASVGPRFHDVSPRGAQLETALGTDTVRLGASFGAYAAGPKNELAGESLATLQVSPIGYFHHSDEGGRFWAPRVDAGALIGAGGGGTSSASFGAATFGGWVDVRLTESTGHPYWSVRATAVREIYTANAPDVTAIVVGVALTARDHESGFRPDF